MKTITLKQANKGLNSYINYILDTNEEINIIFDNGAVIKMLQNKYLSIQETLKLLTDKKSLKTLLISHSFTRNITQCQY